MPRLRRGKHENTFRIRTDSEKRQVIAKETGKCRIWFLSLKLCRYPHSISATLADLPPMSLIPIAPFRVPEIFRSGVLQLPDSSLWKPGRAVGPTISAADLRKRHPVGAQFSNCQRQFSTPVNKGKSP